MSGELKALRVELIGAITGITTYDHVPARAMLPCAFLLAGSPYITAAQTYGARQVRFDLVLLTRPSLNGPETDELDLCIERAQLDLETAGWVVERVQQPEIQDHNGAEVLATTISVACDATFN